MLRDRVEALISKKLIELEGGYFSAIEDIRVLNDVLTNLPPRLTGNFNIAYPTRHCCCAKPDCFYCAMHP